MKVGRNEPCPCGSGRKFKKCHGHATAASPSGSGQASERSYSGIKDHRREGKSLMPPLSQIPNLRPMSWINDRLPEILWGALLVAQLPRDAALSIFRRAAEQIHSFPESERLGDVTHSGLAALPPTQLEDFLKAVVPPSAMAALTPLCLFDCLPASDVWRRFLSVAFEQRGYEALAHAVALTLYHQSQEATDCRWLKVLTMSVSGHLVLPSHTPEIAEEILKYPHYGDMRKVRPTIRAMEGSFATAVKGGTEWPLHFWMQCMKETGCAPLEHDDTTDVQKAATSQVALESVFAAVVSHARRTQIMTDVDARHDCVFGMALYSLSLLFELLRSGNPSSILARPALRTLVECYLTLAYLLKKDSQELWMSHRNYGAGQAKLSYLKLKESGSRPHSVSLEVLEQLANEDRWQEFVPIDLGHWDKTDLRRMSEEAGVKQTYDRFYGWTSTFAHGHWCAIRDSVFATCGNSLHRLHRIPRAEARQLPDVMADACEIVDLVLGLVSRAYPTFDSRTTLK
jgi:Family of unknown function (DUF5677)/SEC-C motif